MPKVVAKTIDVPDVIERIFSSNKSNRLVDSIIFLSQMLILHLMLSESPDTVGLLREPIPLAQMIDILTDFWEADGLYE